jgi:glyoxylase-like metal-dependent hydrolase (beta-lactamase superfamily II)
VRNIPANLYCIRGIMGCCHLLVDGDASVMIDAGLAGEPFFIRRRIRRLGLQPGSIRAILLTHGHLDHAGNLNWLKRWSGAQIYGHHEEQRHLEGAYAYQGVNRWCGRLESLGRAVLRYRPATIDYFLTDGQSLPFWGGLQVVHLPGHTAGHCGFYSERHGLLFSGDMFASYFFNVHKPPEFLNTVPERFPESVEKIRQLRPLWIVPSHYDFLDGALHRRRFARLFHLDDWPLPA